MLIENATLSRNIEYLSIFLIIAPKTFVCKLLFLSNALIFLLSFFKTQGVIKLALLIYVGTVSWKWPELQDTEVKAWSWVCVEHG